MTWYFSKSKNKLWHEPLNGVSWSCEAHNDPVPGSVGYPGGCPPGTYILGDPENNDPGQLLEGEQACISMGPYFIPINNIPGHAGIGIHGGGSASPHPLAAHQGFYPTENCIRVQNDDLYHLALNIGAGDTLIVQD